MALIQRKGIWQWRKMIDGVMLNRSTGTDDKKLAEQLARKWEHEAVQSIKYQGERPVTVHDAIKGFLDERKHMKGYDSALTHMNRWKAALPDVLMKSLRKQQVQSVIQKRIAQGVAHNSIAVFVIYWNALINYCERNKLSAGPKADRVQAKPTRFRVITLEEEAAILAATCPHAKYPGKNPLNDSRRQDNQDVMVCLMHLGARINEAQNLRWTDINFTENTILVRRLKRGDECLLVAEEEKIRAKAEVEAARNEIYAIAHRLGMPLKDLIGTGIRKPMAKVAVQYRNPKNASQEWSGRGRQPKWVKELVASGADLQTAKVKA